MSLLLMRYGWSLRLTAGEIAEVWERACSDTHEAFESLGVSVGSLSLPPVNPPAWGENHVRSSHVAV